MQSNSPISKHIVLIGGGHAHVAVLKSFGMRPQPGVRLTLISKGHLTPYSGMLPGLLAGHYTPEQAHIDLGPLCLFAKADFYRARVTGLDLQRKQVFCEDRPPVSFDFVSIDIGSTPAVDRVPGAREHAIPVKPIGDFIDRWDGLTEKIAQSHEGPIRVAVVGGGAGGVELCLSVAHRLRPQENRVSRPATGSNDELSSSSNQENKARADGTTGGSNQGFDLKLVTNSNSILPTHNTKVQTKFRRILSERSIELLENHAVVRVEANRLICDSGKMVGFDAAFWVTQAAAAPWIEAAGLETDDNGFLTVNDCLQSPSHPFVFGAGDIASVTNYPRPKSGVFAVRQGPPLARNLRRIALGEPLVPYRPQKQFLSLISTGNRYAVASRGPFAFEGAWVWKWKNWIDLRWMRRYQELPEMTSSASAGESAHLPRTANEDPRQAKSQMRCAGCGSKVGSNLLRRVLDRLDVAVDTGTVIGLNQPDDAAVLELPRHKLLVQTVDFFRSFLNDPYLFGRIATNHFLSDLFAMGARPQTAQVTAVVPYGDEPIMEEQLFQLMNGLNRGLLEHGVTLVGGHTSEGTELAVGMTVNGSATGEELLLKSDLRIGDYLILTKPLGTGTLFAADMRGKAKGPWIAEAVEAMLVSNRDALDCLRFFGISTCTDVTGFGLIGHLIEMAEASKVAADLYLDSIPMMSGAIETSKAGILSSLQPENLRFRRSVLAQGPSANDERYPLLFDPQTSGGLLASARAQTAGNCIETLRKRGYPHATIIGEVKPPTEDGLPIILK